MKGDPLAQERGLAEPGRGADERQPAAECRVEPFAEPGTSQPPRGDGRNMEFGDQQAFGRFILLH